MHQNNLELKKIPLYALPAMIIFAIIFISGEPVFEDDAYILYQYAKNWTAGYGPVFNIGENVEAYSSFLWVVILAIGGLFTDIAVLAPKINMVLGLVCLLLISYISTLISFSRPRLTAVLLPIVCAVTYQFYYYAASGMLTVLFALVLMLCMISLHKCKNSGNYLTALPFLFLMMIMRAEGFTYVFIMLSVLTFIVLLEKRKIPSQLILTIIVSAGLVTLLFYIRHSVYNLWTSTPILAKGYATHAFKTAVASCNLQDIKEFIRVMISGLQYEAFFFYMGGWIPFVVLLWYRKENKGNVLLWLFAGVISLNVFFSIWAGGDYMPFKRRFLPFFPLLILFFAWSIDIILKRNWQGSVNKKIMLSIFVVLIAGLWIGLFVRSTSAPDHYYYSSGEDQISINRTDSFKELSILLNDIDVPVSVLTNMQGMMAYYGGPKTHIIDILGITNYHNAKHGMWIFNYDGIGSCGRTDFEYSFTREFDMFFYNSFNMHKRFLSFCAENDGACDKFRFFKSEKWPGTFFYVIADINHPVAAALMDKFDAVPFPVNEDLRSIITVN